METEKRGQLKLGVSAADGEVGVFVPHKRVHRSALLAPTVAAVRDNKILVPVVNAQGSRLKLPSKEALGQCIPVTSDLQLMEINGDWIMAEYWNG